MIVRTWIRLAVVLAAMMAVSFVTSAQTSNGTLVGAVTDQSGAVVPNVDVKAVSPQFGEVHEAKTDAAGTYRIESLQPGTYSVTFTVTGLAALRVGNVIINASVETTVNGQMQLGTIQTTVTVEAGAAQVIDTQSGQLGESLGTMEIENLPYSSFNPAELALTLPGVQETESNNTFSNGFSYSVDGTRPRANNFLIEGQDDNDYSIGGQAFQPTNLGAIQEFTILTNAYSAEFGRGGGSVGNYIYKSGTNNLHGQLWEVNQDSAFAGNDAANKFIGVTKPLSIENTFGFDIGGPVIKDKLFFFATSQWDPTAARATGTTYDYPTAAGVATLESLLPNSNVELLLTGLDGIVSPEDASGNGLVQPTCIDLGSGRGCVQAGLFARSGVREESHDNNWNVRLDYHAGPNDVLSGSYIRGTNFLSPDFFNSPGTLPAWDTFQDGSSNVFRGQWTHTFSPNKINELRFSYTNIGFFFLPTAATLAGPLANLPELSFGTDTNFPSLGIPDGIPDQRQHETIQVQDALTYTFGRHTLKMGADITFLHVRDGVPFDSRGSIVYSTGGVYTSLGNFVDDYTGGDPGGVDKVFGNPFITPSVNMYMPYIEDTWHVRDNLTFTFGLRYEYWGTLANSLQYPAIDHRLTFGVSGAVFPNSFAFQQQPDMTNFGPRLGFAYTPKWGRRFLGNEATVIRGGYGIFYDGLFTNIVDNTAAGQPNATGGPINGGSVSGRGIANAMSTLASITPTLNPQLVIFTMVNNLKNPMTQQWNLDVQRELPLKLVLTAAYVGTRGERLFGNEDLNPGIGEFDADGNAILENPNFNEIATRANVGTSWYNAGQLELERKVGGDLTLRTSYTYSHFLDDVSEVFTTTTSGLTSYPQILTCQICDWGNSTYDRRHRLVFSYVWALPYSHQNRFLRAITDRWQWSSIGTFETGSPDTPFDGFDNIGNNHPNSRPNLSNPKQPLTALGFDGSLVGISAPGTYFPWTFDCVFFGDCPPSEPASDFHFIIPGFGPGDARRNSIYGPGQWYFDTSIQRTFPFHIGKIEHQSLMFRTEFFNAFNHPNLFTPSYDMLSAFSGQYDNTAATIAGARTIKFWLRYDF